MRFFRAERGKTAYKKIGKYHAAAGCKGIYASPISETVETRIMKENL